MPKVQRKFQGIVVSTAENKTVHVQVETIKMHPKYSKQYKTHKKYAVHDETNQAALGDVVEMQECRPLSKTKRWRLIRIVKKTA
ncbi:MAG: 30S ribosomal protein S17 [Candidatus Magasanikbacteria bacterium CG10_big_fil_rev_8_21_14_0_10_38_6]|uniref:Small ribosomal subunit protein uS17 n=1 Tax=Candidatus Magasanikbacteria bacterium CG10_big_fil_rev_8_21_14_0_10_38_6 TaxID=1974647 RepID=A0A2M6P0A4_9BACT|nr:MAG: 30S ribosomal protein S17 [Candidatus Magasanikbacteria bacterium CG10_big_fil_rev_8_21_14_0_10_38_6]